MVVHFQCGKFLFFQYKECLLKCSHLNLYFLLSEKTKKEIAIAQITAYEIKCNLRVQLFHNQCDHFVHYQYNLHKMYLFNIVQKDVKGMLKS